MIQQSETKGGSMAKGKTGARGVYAAEVEERLPYGVYDADNHIYPPEDAEVRHLEKKYLERAFPTGQTHRGRADAAADEPSTAGEGPRYNGAPVADHGGVNPLQLSEMRGTIRVPGATLSRLNPMRDLDGEGRKNLVQKYREIEPAFEDRDLRIQVMDAQGVQAAVIHADEGSGGAFNGRAFERDDVSAGYAAARAWNRYLQEDWGFAFKERIFTPAYIPLVDVDMAVEELERCMNEGARLIGLRAGGSFGRSPADPYFDPFWSRVNEAKLPVVLHLSGLLAHRGGEWSEDPQAPYGNFNGFQWLSFWCDFPIMETVAMLVFHSFMTRFPHINVLIAEFGALWLPYLVRKMDHAHMLGRLPKWAPRLPVRPSELFKTRFLVAPFPEENVQRAMDAVGAECLVFGSDFPHAEGVPDPVQYVSQLKGHPEPVVKAIMRDNLARFLGAQ